MLVLPIRRQRVRTGTGGPIFLDTVWFLVGLLLLYYGAEWLVKGASGLARSLGIAPLVIGLTVVAFGTSAPELVVSVLSAIKAKSMIAVGNVVGSNICNIALVLGLSAVLRGIPCHPAVIARDLPLMLATSLFLLLLSVDSYIARWEGAALFAGVVVYTFGNYWAARAGTRAEEPASVESSASPGRDLSRFWAQMAAIAAGIFGVVMGAELLVDAAVAIMHVFGVGEKFIGLTIVAFGTSLPEMATSVVAALRKEMEISVGNLIGSNVFNILSVVGAAALVRPIALTGGFFASGLLIDYLVMMGVSAMPWLLARRSNTVSRSGGAILLASYVVYVAYLVVEP